MRVLSVYCASHEVGADYMTSEVALMNRNAVALAADSAATVSYWNRDEEKTEQRYFKSANKIFNLVSGQPVGLMTYQKSSLQGMPWEILVKAYRDHCLGRSKDELSQYADDFFKFLASNRDIFSEEDQDRYFASQMLDTAKHIMLAVLYDDEFEKEEDQAKKEKIAQELLDELKAKIDSNEFINPTAEAVYDLVGTPIDADDDQIEKDQLLNFGKTKLGSAFVNGVLELASISQFKRSYTDGDYTGIVFAGFGDRQFYAHLEHYVVYGIYKNTVICDRLENGCKNISATNVAEIVPIAQSKMIDTFMLGADLNLLEAIEGNVINSINKLHNTLITEQKLDADADVDIDQVKINVVEDFKKDLSSYIWNKHASPLRRVIGMFSAEELAELAETFVSVESLKERVTKPTETVSGPIDVAVISKGDGFIWVARKHYFDPSLNLRFVAKKQQELKG